MKLAEGKACQPQKPALKQIPPPQAAEDRSLRVGMTMGLFLRMSELKLRPLGSICEMSFQGGVYCRSITRSPRLQLSASPTRITSISGDKYLRIVEVVGWKRSAGATK